MNRKKQTAVEETERLRRNPSTNGRENETVRVTHCILSTIQLLQLYQLPEGNKVCGLGKYRSTDGASSTSFESASKDILAKPTVGGSTEVHPRSPRHHIPICLSLLDVTFHSR